MPSHPLPAPLSAALQQLSRSGTAPLPSIKGLSVAQVVRWLSREAQTDEARWPVLRWPAGALAGPGCVEEAVALAAGA